MTGSLMTIKLDANRRRVVIIAARFNAPLVDQLVEGATQAWRDHGGEPSRLLLERVPGAFELPLAAKMFAASGGVDAVVALGCVIRGDTYHFEVVANESARGLARVSLEYGVPIANAILTTDTDEQARARVAEKGRDAARTAVEMANLLWALDENGASAATSEE